VYKTVKTAKEILRRVKLKSLLLWRLVLRFAFWWPDSESDTTVMRQW